MAKSNVFINKEDIDKKFNSVKYRNCMDKKYFEYIESNEKTEYIDKYLEHSKDKVLIEKLVFENKVIKVIDRLIVKVENKRYVGELENSLIDNIEISSEIISKYGNEIIKKGIFALITLEENIDKRYPYYIEEIEELEDINVNLDDYKRDFLERVKAYRDKSSLNMDLLIAKGISLYDEISEIDLILNTIGISTKELTFWEKILFLVRLIPLCEDSYNLMELGGNGIGKTKTYSMFSPECEIVQEMLATELICNLKDKVKGALDLKEVIVFDEVNKIKLEGDKEKIIPQLLNFMSDGQTTAPRKVISRASLVFSGNVMGIQERLEKNEKNIFDTPHKFEDNAFLDRIHFFLPAWGLRRYSRNIHGLGLSKDVFRFDYFSKVLSLLRKEDYSDIIDEKKWIIRGKSDSEREVKAIRKTVSGLIKLTHPDRKIDEFTLGAYIAIAIKGRGLVNKFLNNKNKKNVSKIDIEVVKIDYGKEGKALEIQIPVNEMLKNLINSDHLDELNVYFERYKEEVYSKYELNYSNFFKNYNYEFSNPLFQVIKQNIENNTFYSGKFYPNRQVIVLNSRVDSSQLIFVKFALDKMGVEKNRREKKMIKEYYGIDAKVGLLKNDRTLLFESRGIINTPNLNYYSSHEVVNVEKYLYDNEELNYDELFGDQSLDRNDFTGTTPYLGTRNLEADLSNSYIIDKNKKLKLENGNYVIPQFKYSIPLEKYFYEYLDIKENEMKKSEMMTYVEFKYFLADNGFIELD